MQIHSLGYIGINSTNPNEWIDYGTKVLGLEDVSQALRGSDSESAYLKMDDRPYRFFIQKSKANGLAFTGWEVAGPKQFDTAIETLKQHRVDFEVANSDVCTQRQVQALISFSDPDGNGHELYWGPISDFRAFNSPIGVNKFITGDQGAGHVVLPAVKFDASNSFYTEVMGFELSDFMKVRFSPDPQEPEKRLNFMHCNHRHHSLAIFEMENPTGCIHLMLETDHVDEVGRALDRVKEHGVKLTGTLGRHANDHMVSFYMASPGGFMIEYGAEGRTVDDWSRYSPFQSTVNSFWGHDFNVGMD